MKWRISMPSLYCFCASNFKVETSSSRQDFQLFPFQFNKHDSKKTTAKKAIVTRSDREIIKAGG
jgi:hypothetical protein